MAIQSLTHIGICVSDLDRSLRFYRDVLGFEPASELEVAGEPAATLLELENVKLRAVYLERDGVRIELLHYAIPGHRGDGTARPMNELGLTHLSLRIDDPETLLEGVRNAGGRVLERTRIFNEEFRAGALFVTDPDGTRIELVCVPAPADDPGA